MQDALDLLNAVLPNEGLYAGWVARSIPYNVFRQTREELVRTLLNIDVGSNSTPYFCTVSFKSAANRKRENVAWVREFRADIDVRSEGRHHRTLPEAVSALAGAVESQGWPRPWLVLSGHGLHAHWPLAEPMTPEAWEPYARAFQKALAGAGVLFDAAGTVHPCHVLRLPGTVHKGKWEGGEWKPGNPVQVKLLCRGACLAPLQRFNLTPGAARPSISEAAPPEIAQIVEAFDPVAPATVIPRCRQLREAILNGATTEDPLFCAAMGVMRGMVGGEALARKLASMREKNALRFEDRWSRRTVGSCHGFRDANPNGCEGCPKLGAFKTPLQWAGEPVAAPTPPAPKSDDCLLPAGGFDLSEDGVTWSDPDGEQIIKIVSPTLLYVKHKSMGQFSGKANLLFRQKTESGWLDVDIGAEEAHNPNAFAAMHGRGIRIVDRVAFARFVTAWSNHHAEPLTAYDEMGWLADDGGFLLGRRMIRASGTETVLVTPELESYAAYCDPCGDFEKWKKGLSYFNPHLHAEREAHAFVLMCGFASPLLRFRLNRRGAGGLIVHGSSRQGGVGKSLAAYAAEGIWGQPTGLTLPPAATRASRAGHMVRLHHLPCGGEEFNNRDPVETLEDIRVFTSGTPKMVVVDSKSGQQAQRAGSWCNVLLSSSNKSMAMTLAGAGDGQALMERVIDLRFPERAIRDESALARIVEDNFGLAGKPYIEHLFEIGVPAVKARLEALEVEVNDRYGVKLDQRFHVPLLAAVAFALEVTSPTGLGWTAGWDRWQILDYAANSVSGQRAVGASTDYTPFELLAKFNNEMMKHIYDENALGPGWHVEVYYGFRDRKRNRLWLEKRRLQDFVHRHGLRWSQFVGELIRERMLTDELVKINFLRGGPIAGAGLPVEAVGFDLARIESHGIASEPKEAKVIDIRGRKT